MKSYIHFIRHGITEGNVKKWYYGWTDVPLLDQGVIALEELKKAGIYPELGDADCYTSGLIRTEQTFMTIFGDAPHKIIPQFKEMNFGDWECRTFEELQKEEIFDQWVNDKTGTIAYPNGDSIGSFYARVSDGLNELIGYQRLKELSHRHSGKDAVSIVVCHGGVIAACMETMFPGKKDNFWQWIPEPGRGYTVSMKDGESTGFEKI